MKLDILNNLNSSATLTLNDKINKLKKEGKDIIHFGFGGSPFPIPDFLINSLKENAYKNEYLPVKGLPELRSNLADYYSTRDQTSLSLDNIVIGPGSKELLSLIQMSFTDSCVYIPTPTWVSYSSHSKLANHSIKYINTKFENNWKLSKENLQEIVKNNEVKHKILILNSPSNPTGTIYNKTDLTLIAETLKNENITVILDEIYEHQSYSNSYLSLAQLLPNKCIITSGLSKSMAAGGWRLGWCVIPFSLNYILTRVVNLASETYSTANTPIQYATCSLFNSRYQHEKTTYLQNCNHIMNSLTRYCTTYLRQYKVNCIYPEASWYLFLDFSYFTKALQEKNIFTSKELCNSILNEINIAILSGDSFGISDNHYTARLCLVNFDGKIALNQYPENNDITEKWMHQYCKNSIDGIYKLCEWLNHL